MMNKTMYMHGAFGIHLNILKNKGTDICYINKFAYMCYDDSMTWPTPLVYLSLSNITIHIYVYVYWPHSLDKRKKSLTFMLRFMNGLYMLTLKPSYACAIVMLGLPYSLHVCNMYVLLTRCKRCEMVLSHIHFIFFHNVSITWIIGMATSSFHSVIITNNALRLMDASILEYLCCPLCLPFLDHFLQ